MRVTDPACCSPPEEQPDSPSLPLCNDWSGLSDILPDESNSAHAPEVTPTSTRSVTKNVVRKKQKIENQFQCEYCDKTFSVRQL